MASNFHFVSFCGFICVVFCFSVQSMLFTPSIVVSRSFFEICLLIILKLSNLSCSSLVSVLLCRSAPRILLNCAVLKSGQRDFSSLFVDLCFFAKYYESFLFFCIWFSCLVCVHLRTLSKSMRNVWKFSCCFSSLVMDFFFLQFSLSSCEFCFWLCFSCLAYCL